MSWAIIECPCCGSRMELGKHISMQTRADGIRSMSDEELADFLYVKICEDGYPQFTSRNDWLDWLKQEAE